MIPLGVALQIGILNWVKLSFQTERIYKDPTLTNASPCNLGIARIVSQGWRVFCQSPQKKEFREEK